MVDVAKLIEVCRDDFPRLCYDGFGIMLSPEQEQAYIDIGPAGPVEPGQFKSNWLSGGTRAGKTVFGCLWHFDGGLYKKGLDVTDHTFWRNYAYGLLHIAPTDELALRMYAVGDTIAKGTNEAQYDRKARRSRGGALLGKVVVGKLARWGIFRYATGGFTDFRSSEGRAFRLEGGSWWSCTWDEWASQPDREISFVRKEVLLARLRDHDGKLMPMAWPKAETEHHLIEVTREIEEGKDTDSQVVYLSSESAFFTNKKALEVERRTKDKASWSRTVLGRPAGGGAKEFKPHMLDNLFRRDLPAHENREDGYWYLSTWDLGLANDSTVGMTWRIPIVGGRRVVSPEHKARIVNHILLAGGDDLTPDRIAFEMAREQQAYRAQLAMDATGMGGEMAFRQVKEIQPRPWPFKSRANDRVWGNMRLAAVTNGLDCLEWGRPDGEPGNIPWGLFEAPWIVRLNDQLLWYDRDEERPDDWVWCFLIGAWFIRRHFAIGAPGKRNAAPAAPVPFDVRTPPPGDSVIVRRRRGRLITMESPVAIEDGQVFIKDGGRYVPPSLARRGR